MSDRAGLTRMDQSTAADGQLIGGEFKDFNQRLPERILAQLRLLDGDCGGFPIDRFRRCLQSATLTHRDGRDGGYLDAMTVAAAFPEEPAGEDRSTPDVEDDAGAEGQGHPDCGRCPCQRLALDAVHIRPDTSSQSIA